VGGQRGSVGEGEVAGVRSTDNNGFSNLACRRGALWVNYTWRTQTHVAKI
jgi:hypothetical protein